MRSPVPAVFDMEEADLLVFGPEAPDIREFLSAVIMDVRRGQLRERKILDAFRDGPIAEKALPRKAI